MVILSRLSFLTVQFYKMRAGKTRSVCNEGVYFIRDLTLLDVLFIKYYISIIVKRSWRLNMKGIILAGGMGTRLYPLTLVTSKQMLPVYDKPMIYYPLSTLMLAGIREVLIITNPHNLASFEALLGNGEQLGMSIHYKGQPKPSGLPEAFILGEEFLAGEPCALILGDNIFYGSHLSGILKEASQLKEGAINFAFHVRNPEDYGIVEFDTEGKVLSLEEKPVSPKSNFAVTGLYFADGTASGKAKSLKPSARGETEIVEFNRLYLKEGKLSVRDLGRGMAWFDAGSHASLLEVAQFVESVENRQGYKIGCIEEIAFRNGWINSNQLKILAQRYISGEYGKYLSKLGKG
jgi:glucose-1-phosphate thymidylyltransferase